MSEQMDLRSDVTFVDYQHPSQMSEILKAADIFISPLRPRGIDATSLLAMGAGVCVLVTGTGAWDFLIDGSTAMFFRQDDSADLTAKLTALLDNRTGARALAGSALSYLHEHHSPAGMVSELTAIYRNAVESK